MRTAYPTSSDLTTFLTGAGFSSTVVAALDTATAVTVGIEEFESAADRRFLAVDTNSERRFNPPTNGPALNLRRDLASINTLSYQELGGTASTLTNEEDFVLEPLNHGVSAFVTGDRYLGPYTRVRFTNRRWLGPLYLGQRGAIRISGKWGWGVLGTAPGMPEPVWNAMLVQAAWHLFPSLAQVITGGRLGYKDDDVSEDFGVESWTRLRDGWAMQHKAALGQYGRKHL